MLWGFPVGGNGWDMYEIAPRRVPEDNGRGHFTHHMQRSFHPLEGKE